MIKIPTDFPWLTVQEKIKNRQVNLIGVAHHRNYLTEYGNFLKTCVQQSNTLIIEGNVPIHYDPRVKPEYAEFFQFIINEAYDKKQDIWSIDPLYQNLMREEALNGVKVIGGMGLIYYAHVKKISNYYSSSRMSRRKALGLTGLSLAGLASTVIGIGDISHIFGLRGFFIEDMDKLVQWGFDDVISHDMVDYRNIKIAQGLQTMIEISNEDDEIIMIAGEAHIDPVWHYFSNKELRIAKAQTYPENLIFDTSLRKYSPNKEGWIETERIKH